MYDTPPPPNPVCRWIKHGKSAKRDFGRADRNAAVPGGGGGTLVQQTVDNNK